MCTDLRPGIVPLPAGSTRWEYPLGEGWRFSSERRGATYIRDHLCNLEENLKQTYDKCADFCFDVSNLECDAIVLSLK